MVNLKPTIDYNNILIKHNLSESKTHSERFIACIKGTILYLHSLAR